VPPLRERLPDVPELVEHFLARLCDRFGMPRKGMGQEALALLMRYDWRRNNVRELRNVVERMLIASQGPRIEAVDVPGDLLGTHGGGSPRGAGADGGRSYHEQKARAERAIVLSALHAHEWHITRTAEALGLADHASLLKIMRRLKIRRGEEETEGGAPSRS
jgi:DNA-binding NtrC family response regulator